MKSASVSAIRTQIRGCFSSTVPRMFEKYFQLMTRINHGMHMRLTVAGIVLIHIAAVLLYTSAAPYVGSLLAFAGFALYGIGMRRPFFKPTENPGSGGKLFKA